MGIAASVFKNGLSDFMLSTLVGSSANRILQVREFAADVREVAGQIDEPAAELAEEIVGQEAAAMRGRDKDHPLTSGTGLTNIARRSRSRVLSGSWWLSNGRELTSFHDLAGVDHLDLGQQPALAVADQHDACRAPGPGLRVDVVAATVSSASRRRQRLNRASGCRWYKKGPALVPTASSGSPMISLIICAQRAGLEAVPCTNTMGSAPGLYGCT